MIIRLWQEVEVQKDDRLIRKSANGNKEEAGQEVSLHLKVSLLK
jgi:hypothetical protein